MLRHSYLRHDYLSSQLNDHMRRIKLLAQLQSQLDIKDGANLKLKHKVEQLVNQNYLLQQKAHYPSTSKLTHHRQSAYRDEAICRAEVVLSRKRTNVGYATPSSTKYQSRVRQMSSHQQTPTLLQRESRNSKSTAYIRHQSPESTPTKLSKEAYVEHKMYASATKLPEYPIHRKLVSFKKEEQPQPQPQPQMRVKKREKFPSEPNEFHTNSAIGMFKDCELSRSREVVESQVVGWNSQIGMKSQLQSHLKNSSAKRKKQYLSIVSGSSLSKSEHK